MKTLALPFGPKVRAIWHTVDRDGTMVYGSLLLTPEQAAALSRDLANAALSAAAWRPDRRLIAIRPDGGKVYAEDASDEGAPQ